MHLAEYYGEVLVALTSLVLSMTASRPNAVSCPVHLSFWIRIRKRHGKDELYKFAYLTVLYRVYYCNAKMFKNVHIYRNNYKVQFEEAKCL